MDLRCCHAKKPYRLHALDLPPRGAIELAANGKELMQHSEGVVLDRWPVYKRHSESFFRGTTVMGFTASLPYLDDQPRPPKELNASVYRHGCDPPLR